MAKAPMPPPDFSATSPMPNYQQMASGGAGADPLAMAFKDASAPPAGGTPAPSAGPRSPRRAKPGSVNVTILHLGRALDRAKKPGA